MVNRRGLLPVNAVGMSECEVPEMPDGRERVEGLQFEDKIENKEMDILKDLPSFNSENFSKFLSHGGNGCSGGTGSVSTSSEIGGTVIMFLF